MYNQELNIYESLLLEKTFNKLKLMATVSLPIFLFNIIRNFVTRHRNLLLVSIQLVTPSINKRVWGSVLEKFRIADTSTAGIS